MKNDLTKWMNILKVVLAVIGIGSCLLLFSGPNNTAELSEIESFRDGGKMNAATYFTIFILVACVALVLFFFIRQFISTPKKTLMSIIGIVVALVLYLILFGIGTSDTADSLALTESIGNVSKGTITSTTAGLYTVLIGLVVAVLAIVATPLIGKLRK
jgi:hypothetical protein|tara:strand:+ start:3034 stop:3507 length:474 start_codon:yes stop_codon:yes gene_type:complete